MFRGFDLIPSRCLRSGGLRFRLAVLRFNLMQVWRRRRLVRRRVRDWFHYKIVVRVWWFFHCGLIRVYHDSYNDGESWGFRSWVFCLPWVYRRARVDCASWVRGRSRIYGGFPELSDPLDDSYNFGSDLVYWDYDYPESMGPILDIAGAGPPSYRGPGLSFMGDPDWSFRRGFVVRVRQSGGLDI